MLDQEPRGEVGTNSSDLYWRYDPDCRSTRGGWRARHCDVHRFGDTMRPRGNSAARRQSVYMFNVMFLNRYVFTVLA